MLLITSVSCDLHVHVAPLGQTNQLLVSAASCRFKEYVIILTSQYYTLAILCMHLLRYMNTCCIAIIIHVHEQG